jgi:hypothetical protein
MVWDNQNAGAAGGNSTYCASNYANPYVCGTTAYTVPTGYDYWQDLSGTVRSINETVPSPFYIGLNPILLCTTSTCLP